MSRVKNMTEGHPAKLILSFAFPLILTNMGQQLYSLVDTVIVGRGVGVKALAAVGCTMWIYGIICWSMIALTQGFSTFISRYFGGNDYESVNKSIAVSAILSFIVGAVLTIVGLIASRPVLIMLDTPSDILEDANTYLSVMTAGTLIITAYNLAASVLRAFGDGRSPLIAMIIAAVLNIILDLLLVYVIPCGVFGAAVATVTSQLISFLYCMVMIKKIEFIKLKKEHFASFGKLAGEFMRFSMPLAIQHAVLAAGGAIMQSTINLQGSIFIAGFTATNKLYGLLESTAISLGFAITTYASQNYGAGNLKRVKEGLGTSAVISVILSVFVTFIMIFTGKFLLQLFINPAEAGAAESMPIAYRYLVIMSVFLVILYLIYVYRSVLQAIGNSFWSMISGFSECAARIFIAKVAYIWLGVDVLYYIEPAAWLGALIFLIVPCLYYQRKLLN